MKFKLNPPLDQWGPTPARILHLSFWFGSVTDNKSGKWGTRWAPLIGEYIGGEITFWWEKRVQQDIGKENIGKWFEDTNNFRKLKGDYSVLVRVIEKLRRQIFGSIKKKYDVNSIIRLLKKWEKVQRQFGDLTTVFEVANYAIEEHLAELLRKFIPPEELSEVINKLLIPEKFSYHKKSEIELLSLYLDSRNRSDLENRLLKFAEEWSWVENSYGGHKQLDADYFATQLVGITKAGAKKRISKSQKYLRSVVKKKTVIARRYQIPRKIFAICTRLAFSIWWQDDRKKHLMRSVQVTHVLVELLSRKYKKQMKDVEQLTGEEWLAFAETGVLNTKQARERAKYAAVVFIGKFNQIVTGRRARKIVSGISVHSENASDSRFIAGVAASKGKAQGKVRVLRNSRETYKIRSGEILVTEMTSPDFVVAMRKSKAIVTNVGGIMSHAAVISRELGIPCVVGTKIGTKVLKDGDLVEVNANTGIVRKIKKQSKK